jgi:hypothetical protein
MYKDILYVNFGWNDVNSLDIKDSLYASKKKKKIL